LDRLYENAHAFILPSRAECSAIVFAEAASYGLPIISRNVGGISSMVADGENCILVGPEDSSPALQRAIKSVLDDPGKYASMSRASLDLYKARLNWSKCCARVLDIIESVVDHSK
jgi:glycosyltransferase involved in cell wall biosynthesis